MSLVISTVAVIFTFRNNFGWGPLILVTSIGLSGVADGKKQYDALVSFEIWNRRKYPIALRSITVTFDRLDLLEKSDHRGSWLKYRNSMISRTGESIAPQTCTMHELKAPFTTQSLDSLDAPFTVEAIIFDPRLKRTITLAVADKYTLNADARSQARRWPRLKSA